MLLMTKKIVIDKDGFRLNVGIIIANQNDYLFWGRRLGQDSWQFPQGGIHPGETTEQTMYRELKEEVGLEPHDVSILGYTKHWLRYQLPEQFTRQHARPHLVGQKQKWFLLRLVSSDQKIRLNLSHSPEFDSWRWVPYNYPSQHVIYFKREVYRRALRELKEFLHPHSN